MFTRDYCINLGIVRVCTGGNDMDTRPGPWRITFDTNPDDCNLSCIMCEDHSPYSTTRQDRIANGIPKRRMDIDLIKRILSETKGSPLREIIPSTMGEPLIYKHFEEILKLYPFQSRFRCGIAI
jgi:hypothetical protein